MSETTLFCKGGGCTAKLGAGILSRILSKIPRGENDPDLLVGYDSRDDAAVYRLTDDIAFVQTLDFFPADGGGPLSLRPDCGHQCPERYLCHGRRGEDRPEYRLFSREDGFKYPRRDYAGRRREGPGGRGRPGRGPLHRRQAT